MQRKFVTYEIALGLKELGCDEPCFISNVCEEPEELDGLKYALLTNNIEEAWKFVVNYLIIS